MKISTILCFLFLSFFGNTQDFTDYITVIESGLDSITVPQDLGEPQGGSYLIPFGKEQSTIPESFLLINEKVGYKTLALMIAKDNLNKGLIYANLEKVNGLKIEEIENADSGIALFKLILHGHVIGGFELSGEYGSYLMYFYEFNERKFANSVQQFFNKTNEVGVSSIKGASMSEEGFYQNTFEFYGLPLSVFFTDPANGVSNIDYQLPNRFLQSVLNNNLKVFEEAGYFVVEETESKTGSISEKKYYISSGKQYFGVIIMEEPKLLIYEISKEKFEAVATPAFRTAYDANEDKEDVRHPSKSPFEPFGDKYEGDELLTLPGRHKDDSAIQNFINQPGFRNVFGESFEEAAGGLVRYDNDSQGISLAFRNNRLFSLDFNLRKFKDALPFEVSNYHSLKFNQTVEFLHVDPNPDGVYMFAISENVDISFDVYKGKLTNMSISTRSY